MFVLFKKFKFRVVFFRNAALFIATVIDDITVKMPQGSAVLIAKFAQLPPRRSSKILHATTITNIANFVVATHVEDCSQIFQPWSLYLQMANAFNSILWFLVLLFISFFVAGFCAGWYILFHPISVCIPALGVSIRSVCLFIVVQFCFFFPANRRYFTGRGAVSTLLCREDDEWCSLVLDKLMM